MEPVFRTRSWSNKKIEPIPVPSGWGSIGQGDRVRSSLTPLSLVIRTADDRPKCTRFSERNRSPPHSVRSRLRQPRHGLPAGVVFRTGCERDEPVASCAIFGTRRLIYPMRSFSRSSCRLGFSKIIVSVSAVSPSHRLRQRHRLRFKLRFCPARVEHGRPSRNADVSLITNPSCGRQATGCHLGRRCATTYQSPPGTCGRRARIAGRPSRRRNSPSSRTMGFLVWYFGFMVVG